MEEQHKERIILWISRHPITREQESELREAFGEIRLRSVYRTMFSVNDVIELIREARADEVVVNLPLMYVAQLITKGYRPIRSVSTPHRTEDKKVIREHDHFERVLRVEVHAEPLRIGMEG